MIAGFMKKGLKGRVQGSNFKNRSDITDTPVPEPLFNRITLSPAANIQSAAEAVHSKFTGEPDSPLDLFDGMRTPARCYSDYLEHSALHDDCDGYHACLMHILQSGGMKCVLLTYMVPNPRECHTILIAKYNHLYYKIDYNHKVGIYTSIDEIVNRLKALHPNLIDYNLVKFDDRYVIVEDF